MQKKLIVALLLLLGVPSTFAATMQRGDVIGVGETTGSVFEPIYGPVQWIRGTTPLVAPLFGPLFGIASAPDGRFAIADTNVGIKTLDRDFQVTDRGTHAFGSALVFDRAGTLFFLDFDGRLHELDPSGADRRSADLGLPLQYVAIDLAADQCTLYIAPFAAESVIRRFDVCTWTPLTDLSATHVGGGGLRVDHDGTVLASSGDRILRFSRTGQQLDEYLFNRPDSVGEPEQIGPFAFDANDGSLWVNGSRYFTYKVDLASRHKVAGPFAAGYQILSYGVVDEPRAALLPAVAPASVPAASTIGLFVLLAALAGVAVAALPHS